MASACGSDGELPAEPPEGVSATLTILVERSSNGAPEIVTNPDVVAPGELLTARVIVSNSSVQEFAFSGRSIFVAPSGTDPANLQQESIFALGLGGGTTVVAPGSTMEMDAQFTIPLGTAPGFYEVVVTFDGLDTVVSDPFEVRP